MAANSTEMYQGMSEGKPSSRVLAPPGGGSSFSFGGEAPMPSRLNGNKKNMGSDIFGTGDAPAEASPKKGAGQNNRSASNIFGADEPAQTTPSKKGADTKDNIFGKEKAAGVPAGVANPSREARPGLRQFKQEDGNPLTGEGYRGGDAASSQKNSRGGFNPITGQDYGPERCQQPSVKRQQPPGGHSTSLW